MCCSKSLERCMHKGTPVDVFDTVECAGSMISGSHGTINKGFLMYRIFAALYITFVGLWIFYDYASNGWLEYYLIYLTHWGIIIDATYMWSSSIIHFVVYSAVYNNGNNIKLNDYKTIDELQLRGLWTFVLFFLNSCVSLSIFIIILYWTLVHDYNDELEAIQWNAHGVVGSLVTIDWLISTWQLTYWGVIFPFTIGCIYIAFSIVYYILGGGVIYDALDWGEPSIAAAYSIGTLIAIIIVHFLLVAIKNKLIVAWLDTRSNDEKAILIVSNNNNNNGDGNSSVSLTQAAMYDIEAQNRIKDMNTHIHTTSMDAANKLNIDPNANGLINLSNDNNDNNTNDTNNTNNNVESDGELQEENNSNNSDNTPKDENEDEHKNVIITTEQTVDGEDVSNDENDNNDSNAGQSTNNNENNNDAGDGGTVTVGLGSTVEIELANTNTNPAAKSVGL